MRSVVTIRDVAELAGVSVSTVSNALSGQRVVSQVTRQRIQDAAQQLGYRPNTAAHSLRTGVHHAIGLVVPDVTNPFFAEIAHGAETAANALGWSVYLGNTELDEDREDNYLRRLATASDGILFFPTSNTGSRMTQIQSLVDNDVQMVICDERIRVAGTGGVFSDNVAGGRLAAAHLTARGARRCAMITGPETLPTSNERRKGYGAGLRAAGRSLPAERVIHAPYTIEGGQSATAELLRRDARIDAIFAADDLQAVGALEGLAAAGRAVPDDVLVCGFDGIAWGALVRPSLTTVAQQSQQIGAEAARLLLQMVTMEASPREIVLPVELLERDSTRRA
ncbi:LacI family DNA-binding transcriptional regulator [Dactylosporangium sp. CA-092794]|uniref:LacI family DNA-binding transcriptional regulator n=1 Tax=Dactylosporangium sp. CA-092794 TaxID=3239929 RepID=UPI003D91D549